MGSVAKKVSLIVALSLIIVVGVVAAEFLRRGGAFKRVKSHFDGQCTTIEMSASAEDIRIDHGTSLAYLSYLDRRAAVAGKPAAGTVMLVDLNAPQPRVRAALTNEPPDFQPHGMSLYTPLRGTRKLFVISHPPGQAHRIEIFEQTRTGAFAPVKTLTHPLLTSPNAIVAVGPRQFYVVNDSGAKTGYERFQEQWFERGLSTLLYYDGQTMRVVAQGLHSPAGLVSSNDRRTLYVSATGARQMQIFAVDPATGFLKLRETVPLGSAPDNITVSEKGDVWIAAHPKMMAVVKALRDPDHARAPTQVFRFVPGAADEKRLTEVFADSGERLSAGSVAAVHGDRLLLGAILEPKLLDCRLVAPKSVNSGD